MKFKPTVDQINYLNIGLMLVAAVCAFFRPFETFLFAYAFLGPAHYLTEISWLHDRNYFTKRKYDWVFLLLAGVLISLSYYHLSDNFPAEASTVITYIAFMSALVFVTVQNIGLRIALIIAIALSSKLFIGNEYFESIFSAFLPTLIHVFVFTGLFIFVGALRGRSISGILSLIVFAIVAISFFYLPVAYGHYVPTEYVKNSYGFLKNDGTFTEGFISLNYHIMSIFHLHDFGHPDVNFQKFIDGVNAYLFSNPLSLAIMGFIGFAYLYHYLNWFSKTSVIQWHNIPRPRFIAVIVLWIASIALYLYDYSVGLYWLFFLSFTHVILEFPLNQLTFINIGKEIGGIFSGKKPSGKPAKA